MAKKIDRARIESGRFELPKKLAFLVAEKVDFASVTDTDGDWSVQVSAAALQRLVKTKAELKALKASIKPAADAHTVALAAAYAANEESQRALATATRKIKALEKKLARLLLPLPLRLLLFKKLKLLPHLWPSPLKLLNQLRPPK